MDTTLCCTGSHLRKKSLKSFSDYISGRNLVCAGTGRSYSCKSFRKTKINKKLSNPLCDWHGAVFNYAIQLQEVLILFAAFMIIVLQKQILQILI